jgi:predicted DNA-binding transcriptional regulator YafY
MKNLICNAIKNKQRIKFQYNNKTRIVEPQCYGVGNKGTELLRGYQIKGGTQPEPLFDVSKIEALELLGEYFKKPGPNYKKSDSAMKIIFCEL